MSDDAMRYHPDEMTISDGPSDTDMDWLVVSWDLRRVTPSETLLTQFIMVPDAFIIRDDKENSSSWRTPASSPPDGVDVYFFLRKPMLEFAQQETEALLRKSYQMAVEPYAFTVDPTRFPKWPKRYGGLDTDHYYYARIETLGDLVKHHPTMVMKDLFNETFEHRKKQVKRRWKKKI